MMICAAVFLCGCGAKTDPPSNASASPPLPTPARLDMAQRSTEPVTGSDGGLLLTIGDVTGGQVDVSLADAKGATVLAPRSMAPGDTADFDFEGRAYTLRLVDLHNELVGEDTATFAVLAAGTGSSDEADRIERLIRHIAGLKGATFIRNGTAHDAAEAAEHLRRKWRAAGVEMSAAQFIDAIASESSMSGRKYRIRFSDGREVESGAYLHERLRETSQNDPATGASR